MKIQKIYACWVYVSDLVESVKFYQGIGLKVKFQQENWIEFDLGNTSFAILERPKEKGKVIPQKTRIMFEVDSIQKAKELLAEKGIKMIGGIRNEDYGYLLTFEDLDGNWLEFFEKK